MATRQQLRGDGSKEYQIITNLSRGINNAVADDVLVDNAFRDVVNFSSDQLGNISKRDNLLNSNFKEFIRKLAYGDFNFDVFKTKNEDAYTYGRIEQVKLQNFYETIFTDKPFWQDTSYINEEGVATSDEGDYLKVPSYNTHNINTTAITIQNWNWIRPSNADIIKTSPEFQIIEHNEYVDNYNILFFTDAITGDIIPIVKDSVPEGWTLNEDNTVIKKYNIRTLSTVDGDYNELPASDENTFTSSENVELIIKTSEGDLPVSTSIVAQNDTTVATRIDINRDVEVDIEETDEYITFKVMLKNKTTDRYTNCYGVSGDTGWKPLLLNNLPIEDIKDYSLGAVKTFKKSELLNNFSKSIRFVFGTTCYDFCLSKYNVNTLNMNYEEDYTYYLFYTGNVCIKNVKLKHIYVIKQSDFFKHIQDLNRLFEGNMSLTKNIEFDAYFIGYGDLKVYSTSLGQINNNQGLNPNHSLRLRGIPKDEATSSFEHALIFYRMHIIIDTNYNLSVKVDCKTVGDDFVLLMPFRATYCTEDHMFPDSYVALYNDNDVLSQLFLSKYNNYLYLCTGKYSIVKINISPDSEFNDDSISNIGAHNYDNKDYSESFLSVVHGIPQNTLYRPVAYEISNPGFNLIADNPLTCFSEVGSTQLIKGVFYTVDVDGTQEPVQTIPCNIPFNIHIITTGGLIIGTNLSKPLIRPNNGELDESKNPYKELPGSWETLIYSAYFKCEGIDNIEAYEMKLKYSDDEYLTYFTPSPYVPKDTGTVSELSELVLGCPRSKIINNQLVLFGKGGYIFFSDFDNFEYFPNYYYLYVASGTDEEVVDIVYFRQFYAIFTNKRILRMSGDFAADNFEIGPLNDFMGCVNHNTIRQVYNSLYFVGYNGIYSLNQGYLGSGTENLKRIDTQLVDTFNFDNVSYCYVLGSTYIIIMSDGKTWYTYDVDNDMFLRYDYSLGDSVTLANISFIETLEENQIYAILTTNKEGFTFADDLLLYNFPLAKDVNYDYKDSDQGYISSFETPYINLGTPTNTKKFKNLFIKMYNETDSLIPLYVTVYVDDILAITPEDYTIELDEETNTYFYYFKVDNNAELLKAHNVLGELTLGKDTLGDNIIQQLKLKINAKGRAIKIILADGYDYPNKDNSAIIKYRNNKKFSISTIGIVYKLKKVKEG